MKRTYEHSKELAYVKVSDSRAGCIRTFVVVRSYLFDATLLYKGLGIGSASSQVNSKTFRYPPKVW